MALLGLLLGGGSVFCNSVEGLVQDYLWLFFFFSHH